MKLPHFFGRDEKILIGCIAERFGARPSDILEDDIFKLLFDAEILNEMVREEKKAIRKARRKMR